MALNEACQVWIEQRIQEELDERGDTKKSLREIGRELAAEIERVFEAKVNPETIKSRVLRASGSNEPTTETPATTPPDAGDNGDSITPDNVIPMVEKIVKRGMSVREAAAVLADEHGKRADTIRRMYARAREKENYGGTATEAMQFVQIAISQLSRIRKDDPMRKQALETIKAWVIEQETKNG